VPVGCRWPPQVLQSSQIQGMRSQPLRSGASFWLGFGQPFVKVALFVVCDINKEQQKCKSADRRLIYPDHLRTTGTSQAWRPKLRFTIPVPQTSCDPLAKAVSYRCCFTSCLFEELLRTSAYTLQCRGGGRSRFGACTDGGHTLCWNRGGHFLGRCL
jgi:hypothetical protein